MSELLLAGDLGGTKTLLLLAEKSPDGPPRLLREQRYASAEFAHFNAMLADFLAGETLPIAAAAFGVAGPTDGRSAQLTYLPWRLEAAQLQEEFALGRVALVNDFAAAAAGIDSLEQEELQCLQAGKPQPKAPRVVLGAGTGLGVAGLVWQQGAYRVVPGEGGHMGFAPQSPAQVALWQQLWAARGRVTAEDLLCGAGISRIHQALGGAVLEAAAISAAALATPPEALARQTLALWQEIYGAFAGDLALHWLARGGVYIAGGIAARIFPALSPEGFLAAFNAKREHAALAAEMPVYLVNEERLGLLGALALAAQG